MIKYITQAAILILAFNTLYAQKPTFVRPANVGDVPVQYITLLYHTANIKDANTDDEISIQLNDAMKSFILNKSNDEFEKNSRDEFIISDPTIKFIRDIKYLRIFKKGSNGWAFDLVQISINGVALYKNSVNTKWLDNIKGFKPTFLFGETEIKNGFALGYKTTAPIHVVFPSISLRDIKNMIETAVGNSMAYGCARGCGIEAVASPKTMLFWGDKSGINTRFGDATEIKTRNSQTLSIDLDLQYKSGDPLLPDHEYDLDFDIVLTCNQGAVTATIASTWGKYEWAFNKEKFSAALGSLLSRKFNTPNCIARFESNGNLKYY